MQEEVSRPKPKILGRRTPRPKELTVGPVGLVNVFGYHHAILVKRVPDLR